MRKLTLLDEILLPFCAALEQRMNQNIHKKVNCKRTLNASICFFTEKMKILEVVLQNKTVKQICLLDLID